MNSSVKRLQSKIMDGNIRAYKPNIIKPAPKIVLEDERNYIIRELRSILNSKMSSKDIIFAIKGLRKKIKSGNIGAYRPDSIESKFEKKISDEERDSAISDLRNIINSKASYEDIIVAVEKLQKSIGIGAYKSNMVKSMPRRVSYDEKNYFVRELRNILYSKMSFSDTMAKIICYVMAMFAEMNVCPDYFFDQISPLYYERRKKIEDIEEQQLNENYISDYEKRIMEFENCKKRIIDVNTFYKPQSERIVLRGIEEHNHLIDKVPSRTITEQYEDVVKKLDELGILGDSANQKESFERVSKRCVIQIEKISNGYDGYRDIVHMVRLLCECFRYFALIGEDPTKRVEKFIDEYCYWQEAKKRIELALEIEERIEIGGKTL